MTFAIVALCLSLAVCFIVCAVFWRRIRRVSREADALRNQLDRFLEGGAEFPVSVEDSPLSGLNRSAARLCEQVELSRENKRLYDMQAARLVADLSHQFKTPLSAMRLYTEMDLERRPDGPAEKQLRLIGHMESLIRSLLRLEKLNANAYEMRMEPGDAAKLAREIAEGFREMHPGKRIIAPEGEALCRYDPYWLGEALSNVIKNACEHTAPEGRVEISARAGDGLVCLDVRDDGGGVAPETLPRLFERFNRAAPESSIREGCGLGLAITRSILLRHHGDALAANGKDGLIVSLYLPCISDRLNDFSLS